MTDPRRKLRRLDDIETGDLWPRVEARSTEPEQPTPVPEGPSIGRRLVTIGVAFAVFAAAGIFLFTRFEGAGPAPGGSSPTPDSAVVGGEASGELMVTCTDGGAVAEGVPVKLVPGGVRIRVDNRSDANFFLMRDPARIGESAAFELEERSTTERTFLHIRPGIWVA
jgi:hypothetical protein